MLRYHFYFKFVYIRTIDEDELRLCYILQRSLCVIRLQQVYVFFSPEACIYFISILHVLCLLPPTESQIIFWGFRFGVFDSHYVELDLCPSHGSLSLPLFPSSLPFSEFPCRFLW